MTAIQTKGGQGVAKISESMIPWLSGYPCFMTNDSLTISQGHYGAKTPITSFLTMLSHRIHWALALPRRTFLHDNVVIAGKY